MTTKPLMRYHGAKWRLAPWIISQMPAHKSYIEPFGGSAAILLSKTPVANEVYNDLNDEIVTLFRTIRDPLLCQQLITAVSLTPYSRVDFEECLTYEGISDPIEISRRLLVRANMAYGSTGASKNTTGFNAYSRPGYDRIGFWRNTPNVITQVADRLASVFIEHRCALRLIKDHDHLDALFYLDPPYMTGTRKSNGDMYSNELSDADHEELLKSVLLCQGMVMISGYESELYNDMLSGWMKSTKSVCANGQSSGGVKRTEVLWISPNCEQSQMDMFGETA